MRTLKRTSAKANATIPPPMLSRGRQGLLHLLIGLSVRSQMLQHAACERGSGSSMR